MKETQYCTMQIDDLLLGVEAGLVEEVIICQEVTQIPLAPREVRGLINLRGQVLPVVDLRVKLDLAPGTGRGMAMIVRSEGELCALLVDRAGDPISLGEDAFEPLPPHLDRNHRELLTGAVRLQDRLMLIIDPAKASAIRA